MRSARTRALSVRSTPIPGGFFDPGSDPFSGIVAFDTAGQNDETMRVQAPDLHPPPEQEPRRTLLAVCRGRQDRPEGRRYADRRGKRRAAYPFPEGPRKRLRGGILTLRASEQCRGPPARCARTDRPWPEWTLYKSPKEVMSHDR